MSASGSPRRERSSAQPVMRSILAGVRRRPAWWSVLCVRGGAVCVPEPLVQFVREATVEDALRAVEYGNEHARREIGRLFPEAVARALQFRQRGSHDRR